ncbi:MAG: hypothetical protein IPG43_16935 [Proteobacteria bacterium]|nr:hypothetical protein [Pseudomonadota bacterium]
MVGTCRDHCSRRWLARPALALLVSCALTACGHDGDGYYPLEAPRWWYYAVDATVLDEPRHSRYLMQNAGLAAGMDNTVYLQTAQAGSVDFLRAQGAGVERVARLRPGMRGPESDMPPRQVLPADVAPGHRWQVPSTLALIESRTFEPRDRIIPRRLPVMLDKEVLRNDAVVEVAAGRFSACLEVEGHGSAAVPTDRGNGAASVAVEVREWYAPGVGLVKLERRETSKSTFLKDGRQHWELLDHGP